MRIKRREQGNRNKSKNNSNFLHLLVSFIASYSFHSSSFLPPKWARNLRANLLAKCFFNLLLSVLFEMNSSPPLSQPVYLSVSQSVGQSANKQTNQTASQSSNVVWCEIKLPQRESRDGSTLKMCPLSASFNKILVVIKRKTTVRNETKREKISLLKNKTIYDFIIVALGCSS